MSAFHGDMGRIGCHGPNLESHLVWFLWIDVLPNANHVTWCTEYIFSWQKHFSGLNSLGCNSTTLSLLI